MATAQWSLARFGGRTTTVHLAGEQKSAYKLFVRFPIVRRVPFRHDDAAMQFKCISSHFPHHTVVDHAIEQVACLRALIAGLRSWPEATTTRIRLEALAEHLTNSPTIAAAFLVGIEAQIVLSSDAGRWPGDVRRWRGVSELLFFPSNSKLLAIVPGVQDLYATAVQQSDSNRLSGIRDLLARELIAHCCPAPAPHTTLRPMAADPISTVHEVNSRRVLAKADEAAILLTLDLDSLEPEFGISVALCAMKRLAADAVARTAAQEGTLFRTGLGSFVVFATPPSPGESFLGEPWTGFLRGGLKLPFAARQKIVDLRELESAEALMSAA